MFRIFSYVFICIILALSGIGESRACFRPIRIMPLGDSITLGTNSNLPLPTYEGYRVGYRQELFQSLVDAGYPIDFVGSQSEGDLALPAFDTDHEGHGGYSANQVADSVYGWAVSAAPDYILLHIGTNQTPVDAVDVERILDEIDRYSTNVTVILARIINKQSYSSRITEFNNNVAIMAQARIDSGDKIVMVDMENALDYSLDMSDDQHPNASGYTKMAQVWSITLLSELSDRCSGVPQIISTPIEQIGLGDTYSYQVDVTGSTPIQLSLSSSPAGMTIDADSGLISWTPTTLGTFNVVVSATNPDGDTTQSFTINVTPQIVIDNGDLGTSSVGSWPVSSGTNPYGTDSVYSKTVGTSYSFEAALMGPQEVSLWWTYLSNRSTAVPVDIYDGDVLLDTVTVNQQADGGQWNVLGNYTFSGMARVVIRSTSTSSTSADAVRFVPIDTTIPVITSSAVTQGSVGAPYTYDVDGFGDPALFYQLLTAPAGMLIDADTGVITWTPSAVGSYAVTVELSNANGSTTQSFNIDVTDPSLELIIDNGDLGTSSVGSWPVSSGTNPYGTDSVYSKTVGTSYSFEAALMGPQEVSLWWTYLSNRSTAVPVDIYDGDVLLDTVTVNQQADGGQWNVLGNYTFSGMARVVIRSTSTSSTSADAVRFVPIDTTIPVITSSAVTQGSVGAPYTYDVDGFGDPALFYQLLTAPAGMLIDADTGVITWTPSAVGSYAVTVELSNANGSTTQSFNIDVTDPSLELIIDNGEVGTSAVGNWAPSGGLLPYGVDSLYSKTAGDTYTFDAGLIGPQKIALWWTEYANRLTNTPVEIYDGTVLLNTVVVNQQVNGGQWNSIGTYNFTTGARVVIRSLGGGTVSADAVQLLAQ